MKVESTKTSTTFNGWVDVDVSSLAKPAAKPESFSADQDSMTLSTQLSL